MHFIDTYIYKRGECMRHETVGSREGCIFKYLNSRNKRMKFMHALLFYMTIQIIKQDYFI